MKKFITFIVILVCIFPIGKILLNTIPNNHNKNQESSIDKTNPQPSSSKENENSSTPTDNFVDINKDESNENILVDVGDNEYILNDCGLLVERDNPLKLSEAIMYALNLDEKERKYYSERAKLRIEENFSIQRVSEEFCKLY